LKPKSFQLITPNQHQLRGYHFAAARSAVATPEVIIIAAAMGAPQRYYHPCAQWLAEQGFEVYTFDYYGMAESAPATLRGLDLNILDWATQDCTTVIAHVRAQHPTARLQWLAHSVGGQLLGAIANHHELSKVVTVATGSGYWLENSPALKRKSWLLWFFVVPISLPLIGYFPGKRLRMVGDLPASIMRQWRRWCLHKDYLIGVEGEPLKAKFATVNVPIISISLTDDELLSQRNIQSLHDFYVNSPRQMIRLGPQDAGHKRIGHFGFFRKEFQSSLWQNHLLPALKS